MPILNYTTTVTVEKSNAEIKKALVKAKAMAIMEEYSPTGVLSCITFRVNTPHGIVCFRLPANVDGVQKALAKQKGVEKRYRTEEHAARVAWRICKDWVEAQLAIVEAEMASMAQVFLPYAVSGGNGQTVYEVFEANNFKALTDQSGGRPS